MTENEDVQKRTETCMIEIYAAIRKSRTNFAIVISMLESIKLDYMLNSGMVRIDGKIEVRKK
jgi:hypothetical protein